jgi:hypothetical protein
MMLQMSNLPPDWKRARQYLQNSVRVAHFYNFTGLFQVSESTGSEKLCTKIAPGWHGQKSMEFQ